MAKKSRRKSKAKTKKSLKKNFRKSVKRKTLKKRRAPKRKGLRAKVSGAYRTVVDTIKGTDRLRNRLEQPGTSESE